MAQKEKLSKEEIIEKIISKKEFSHLPIKDVEKVYSFFEKKKLIQEELVKESRNLLRKMYTAFVSKKLLNVREKESDWFLKKHISTKERFPFYEEVYKKLLKDFDPKDLTVFDLGAGINGFSYNHFPKGVNYVGVEAVGQLVDLMNYYFKNRGLEAWAVQESLFNLEKIKNILKQVKNAPNKVGLKEGVPPTKKARGKKIVFLFKTLDSLEMIEKNYSKEFLKEIMPLVERVVISFATRSLVSQKRFRAQRKWLTDFIKENFKILQEFEIGNEKYISFVRK